ncbi:MULTISPECIES: 2-amino-4-hydroxy-6-hydroxymethyldihydropteridine diphosphokinase [Hyphomonas]|uniref:2-amino-4-hydroxy-6-hydroxymethyldihydropteridine pyrophosphokinase n=1 Tax=Hyphomonas adhaerens TaxID=81029 RepID=A0A3B9GZL8_9PROT|nr:MULTISPECIES: 2-amino-4-hydroxy-6-hydroxymethyldihydropteridine diphosphokinase [Hyphomonas]MBB41750.1 2-amino-4-hydroxy-6-hydroxymethyldihydropteridine diphosphokinase [Hyphomonas sp.]HAE27887.1 2-amino-4-hydroxy-6-hydroxymethyldihydropteridine diphosphokinase [Hyphomonas adhaerens]|tara:strand:- start:525 stop:1052 length:528 start_codon:yes stop_codon:yes gene_type:complete
MAEAYLELGTNLGDREDYLARALAQLEGTKGIRLGKRSRVYVSKAWGVTDQPDFLNICVQIETERSPEGLLDICKGIEQALGRQARQRWGPREIDIDILMMDGVDMETARLTLPHPRMLERRFVMEPLTEIAADREIDGISVADLARHLRVDAVAQACVPDAAATERVRVLLARD